MIEIYGIVLKFPTDLPENLMDNKSALVQVTNHEMNQWCPNSVSPNDIVADTFHALLALADGIYFLRPTKLVMQSFDVFFVVSLNELLHE